MKINIIPHKSQRYDTCGDYRLINNEWVFYISKLPKRRYECLVTLHEVIEAYLCYWLGIKEEDISDFDIEYEKNRAEGDNSEPGNDKNAPYYWQHQIATFIERIVAMMMMVNWKDYDQAINDLE